MSDFFDEMNESFKKDTELFFDKDSVEKRKTLQFYETLIDKLNYQLFIANKKYTEKLREYRISVGLPVKEAKNGDQTQKSA